MLTNEFGGDVGRAQAALAEMQAALDKAPNTAASNDAKAALRGQMARLRAGITATQAGARPAVKVASTPVVPGQSAKPVGPMQQAAAQQSIAPAVGNSQEETVLDQARIATKAAHTKLMAFGSSQRTKDPQGYATVAQAYNSAKALEDKAFSAYNAAAMRALSGNRMVPMATP